MTVQETILAKRKLRNLIIELIVENNCGAEKEYLTQQFEQYPTSFLINYVKTEYLKDANYVINARFRHLNNAYIDIYGVNSNLDT